jgi:hypothetical protein
VEKGYWPDTEQGRERRKFDGLVETFEGAHALIIPESGRRVGLEAWPEFFPDIIGQHCPFPLDARRREALCELYETTREGLATIEPRQFHEPDQHFVEARRTGRGNVLKDDFDAREFHTFMLSAGPMPLQLSARTAEPMAHQKSRSTD